MQSVSSVSLLPWPQCKPCPNETGGDEVCRPDRVQLSQVPGATPALRETGEQISDENDTAHQQKGTGTGHIHIHVNIHMYMYADTP